MQMRDRVAEILYSSVTIVVITLVATYKLLYIRDGLYQSRPKDKDRYRHSQKAILTFIASVYNRITVSVIIFFFFSLSEYLSDICSTA